MTQDQELEQPRQKEETAAAHCDHTEEPQPPYYILRGDDAIRYQSQVIVRYNNDFSRIRAVNNNLQQRIDNIMAVLPQMCSCKAAAYINRIVNETNGLMAENKQLKAQLAAQDQRLRSLLGNKEMKIDQVD